MRGKKSSVEYSDDFPRHNSLGKKGLSKNQLLIIGVLLLGFMVSLNFFSYTGKSVYTPYETVTDVVNFPRQVIPFGSQVDISVGVYSYSKNVASLLGEPVEVVYENETMYGWDSSLSIPLEEFNIALSEGNYLLQADMIYDGEVLDTASLPINVTEAAAPPEPEVQLMGGNVSLQATCGVGACNCGDTLTSTRTLTASDNLDNCNGSALIIKGDISNTVVLNCGGYDIIGNSTGVGLSFDSDVKPIIVEDCNIHNFSLGALFYYPGGGENIIFNNVSLYENDYGLNFSQQTGSQAFIADVLINNSNIFNNTYDGINYIIGGNSPSYNITFSHNNIFSNGESGVDFWQYSNALQAIFAYNDIYNNSQYGIDISSATNGNNNISFIGNNITHNTLIGLRLDSYNSIIKDNLIANNLGTYQIHLPTTANSGNLIYNNIFINDSVSGGLARDDTSGINYWYTSKQLGPNIIGGNYIGGNFYSNFNGYDNTGDGISDNPSNYPIAGTAFETDLLPLANTPVYCGQSLNVSFALGDDVLNSTNGTVCQGNALTLTGDDVVFDCNNYSIVGNGSGIAINITGRNNVTIQNCNISNFYSGIWMADSNHSNIISNEVHDNIRNIDVYSSNAKSDDILLYGNDVYYGNSSGFTLAAVSNATILDNYIYENNNSGILYDFDFGSIIAKDASIINNTIFNNTLRGIHIKTDFGNSVNLSIQGNNITYNNDSGIRIEQAPDVTIRDNIIENNAYSAGYQVDLVGSSNILTYNNIISNASVLAGLANDTVGLNDWNTTKQLGTNIIGGNYIGGNFWSAYTGIDTNGDGIGDSPSNFTAAANVVDYLPLVSASLVCGADITSDITFTGNLKNSTGGEICPANGLSINASDIVIDCDNYSLTGSNLGIGFQAYGFNNITLRDCIISNFSTGMDLIVNSSLILNNTVKNFGGIGIQVQPGTLGNRLLNNTILGDSASSYTLSLLGKNHVISGNDFRGGQGISFNGPTLNISLTDNIIRNSIFAGFYSQWLNNSHIAYNMIYNNSEDGIKAWRIRNSTIEHNRIYDNGDGGIGIDLAPNSYNNITKNYISSNNGTGIIFKASPLDSNVFNTISYNNITNNKENGINLTNAKNTDIFSNRIEDNSKYGILLLSSHSIGGLIYNNHISNNAFGDVNDSGSGNFWNTSMIAQTNIIHGPNIGGNYYSDFDALGARDTDGDGFADAPTSNYTIPGSASSSDMLPLAYTDADGDGYYDFEDCDDNDPVLIPLRNNTENNITSRSILCFGTYENATVNLNLSTLGADQRTFDCNSSTLIDGFSSTGINILSSNTRVFNCKIKNYQSAIVSRENNNSIYDNIIGNFTSGGISISLGNIGNHIYRNYLANGSITVPAFSPSGSTHLIENNTVVNADGLWAVSSTNITIYNNVITNNPNFLGIFLNNAFNSSISYNNISNASEGVILGIDSDNNHVQFNQITDSNRGISVQDDSDNNVINDNYLFKNKVGIRIGGQASENNSFTNNRVLDSLMHGLFIQYGNKAHQNNTFYNNSFENNQGAGILLEAAGNSTFYSNTITNNNMYGIWINSTYSGDNIFYDNFISGNSPGDVNDSGVNNNWNTTNQSGTNVLRGDRIGGNYYSDFIGAKDITGDWFADFPDGKYDIPGSAGATDFLPLAYQDLDNDGWLSSVDCNDHNATIRPIKQNDVTLVNTSILVCPDVYFNSTIQVNNPSLIIDGDGSAILNSTIWGQFAILNNGFNNTLISGFDIRNYEIGINVSHSDKVHVLGNTFYNSTGKAIQAIYAVQGTIRNNVISEGDGGVELNQSSMNLSSNIISDVKFGILLLDSYLSHIKLNDITSSVFSIALANSTSNEVYNNTINGTTGTGMILIYPLTIGNDIYHNTFLEADIAYINSTVLGNNFNITINGSAQGNIYADINSILIYDTDNDGWGDDGPEYPYNSTYGNIVGLAVDYAPKTTKTHEGLPTLDITFPPTNSQLPNTTTINITAESFDDEDGNLSPSIRWNSSIDGSIGVGSPLHKAPGSLSLGLHTITAEVNDSHNNNASDSILLNVTNSTLNYAPIVQITAPATNSFYAHNAPITFMGNATDIEDGIINGTNLTWISSHDGVFGTGNQIINFTGLSKGKTHTITLEARDSQGLVGRDSIVIKRNAQPSSGYTGGGGGGGGGGASSARGPIQKTITVPEACMQSRIYTYDTIMLMVGNTGYNFYIDRIDAVDADFKIGSYEFTAELQSPLELDLNNDRKADLKFTLNSMRFGSADITLCYLKTAYVQPPQPIITPPAPTPIPEPEPIVEGSEEEYVPPVEEVIVPTPRGPTPQEPEADYTWLLLASIVLAVIVLTTGALLVMKKKKAGAMAASNTSLIANYVQKYRDMGYADHQIVEQLKHYYNEQEILKGFEKVDMPAITQHVNEYRAHGYTDQQIMDVLSNDFPQEEIADAFRQNPNKK